MCISCMCPTTDIILSSQVSIEKIFPVHVYLDRTDLPVWSPQGGHNDVS
jgi:hypothetical protein